MYSSVCETIEGRSHIFPEAAYLTAAEQEMFTGESKRVIWKVAAAAPAESEGWVGGESSQDGEALGMDHLGSLVLFLLEIA